jgi:hypothetical protein
VTSSDQASVVLDDGAIQAYVDGRGGVGELLARVSDRGEAAVVPVLCLAEGYRRASPEDALVLDLLASLPSAVVAPVRVDDAAILGGWTRTLGRSALAHAVLEAATHHATLVTDDAETAYLILPKGWPIIEV